MAAPTPRPLTAAERRARRNRAAHVAWQLGFIGDVEYRRVYSQTGGAQYCRSNTPEEDLLTVYAEAFERDADPDDFSLEAMIAHERGHQVLARHPRLSVLLASASLPAEEALASLLGALVLDPGSDRDTLLDKAAFELVSRGATAETAARVIANSWDLLGRLL
jgi:hypothetical protein